jgi:hypothetical protein
MSQEPCHDAIFLERRIGAVEVGHRVLVNQMADIAIEHASMKDEIKLAIREAMAEGISDFFNSAQKRAAEKTGRWLWSAITEGLTKWLVIAAIVVSVGKVAGWPLALSVWDAVTGKVKP